MKRRKFLVSLGILALPLALPFRKKTIDDVLPDIDLDDDDDDDDGEEESSSTSSRSYASSGDSGVTCSDCGVHMNWIMASYEACFCKSCFRVFCKSCARASKGVFICNRSSRPGCKIQVKVGAQ